MFPWMSLALCLGFLVTMNMGSDRGFMCMGPYWQKEREAYTEVGRVGDPGAANGDQTA